MTPGARYQVAIEILAAFESSSLPLNRFLDDWGRAHRYAGAKDRAFIRQIVYAVMRRRGELAWIMGSEEPRQLVLAELIIEEGQSLNAIADLFSGRKYCPESLTLKEIKQFSAIRRKRMQAQDIHDGMPEAARHNLPAWVMDELMFARADVLAYEMAAMARRAPLDLRVNSLKGTRDEALERLKEAGIVADPCPFSQLGLRIAPQSPLAPYVNIQGTEVYAHGLVEVQDESMQLAALLADARPRHQVLDLCAGAGGKTLALAACMGNRGQIFACDSEAARLEALAPRLVRAGVRNVQTKVIAPERPEAEDDPDFADAAGAFDRVIVDAPCSGSGRWRRAPEAKWRLTPERLDHYLSLQEKLLARAAPLVKPGGRLIYVTCSVLRRENTGQANTFLKTHSAFEPLALQDLCLELDRVNGDLLVADAALDDVGGLFLTPGTTHTDGGYVAVFQRR